MIDLPDDCVGLENQILWIHGGRPDEAISAILTEEQVAVDPENDWMRTDYGPIPDGHTRG